MNPPCHLDPPRPVPWASSRAEPNRASVARNGLGFALMLGLIVVPAARAQSADETHIQWAAVAPGIDAALPSHEGRFDDGNSIRIVTADGVVLVDPPTDPAVTAGWIERTKAEGRVVRFVLSTHWHSDHHQTASRALDAFPQAQFIGHRLLQTQIESEVAADHRARVERLGTQVPAAKAALEEGRGLSGDVLDEEQLEAQRAAIVRAEAWLDANSDVTFAVPSIGLGGPTTILLGDVQIHVHLFRAHTDGDLVFLLPGHGIALTGDLLDELPFVGHGAPRSWIETLDRIDHWPVQTFIPGHGAPFGKEQVRKIRSFLQDLVDLADRARNEGVDLDAFVAGAVDDARLLSHRASLAEDDAARRFFDGTLEAALRAAWLELD